MNSKIKQWRLAGIITIYFRISDQYSDLFVHASHVHDERSNLKIKGRMECTNGNIFKRLVVWFNPDIEFVNNSGISFTWKHLKFCLIWAFAPKLNSTNFNSTIVSKPESCFQLNSQMNLHFRYVFGYSTFVFR